MPEDWICLGALTRPHGIKGEICLNLYADSPSLLDGEILLERRGGQRSPVTCVKRRPHKGMWLVTFKEVQDRSAAEELAGATLWMARSALPEAGENEAYIADLLGLEVVLPDGSAVGVFDHIETPAGQMLWAIRSGEYEYLFPARPEFIVSFGETIVIDPPAGLLDTCRTKL